MSSSFATLSLSSLAPKPEMVSLEERSLVRAFALFTDAAASLERSYTQLQAEVTRLRRELADTNRDLEHAQESLRKRQALAEMSALLAHEIRNPLGSMELFAGLLAEADLSEEHRQWVGHLRVGLRTLSATVNNVLHFQSAAPAELISTDLGQVLQEIEEFLRPLAQQASVEMELTHQLHGVCIAADRHRLEQVLLNLALNAFHFMPDGGQLKISGQVVGEMLQFACVDIKDSGPGIAQENLERIFEPGFSTRPGSPGLGLAVCKTIVEQHGGTIEVCSRAGEGTTFVLEFPLTGERQ